MRGEADCYAKLAGMGWSVRKIAGECGTNIYSVSVMQRMVLAYPNTNMRPTFWTAYKSIEAKASAGNAAQNTGVSEWYTP